MRLLRRVRAYARIARRGRLSPATADALRLLARRPALLTANGGYELAILVSNSLDPRLKYLAMLKAAGRIGCPF
jgi:hypothetical protein